MSKSNTPMGAPQPIPEPHFGKPHSFRKIEELAREVLREKGLKEEEIEWRLRKATQKPS